MAEKTEEHISPSFTQSREHHLSSSSSSPSSSRRGSLISYHPGNGLNLPTPISPPLRLTRKRAASINTDAANQPRIEDLALNTPPSSTNILPGEKLCLCQPDPKIPRPRNAFILYRQHHQLQVVQTHPGLANPEISKIIGEQWRDQPPAVKNYWKRLAEEEKKRHQRQYPDYRYQPRRAGVLSRPVRISSSDDPERCPKCNGRYISAPSTPLVPRVPQTVDQIKPLLPPFGSPARGGTPHRSIAIDEGGRFLNTKMDPPRTAPLYPPFRRPGFLQQHPSVFQVSSLRELDEDMEILDSPPELKRRRYNNGQGQGQPSPSPYGFTRPPMSAIAHHDPRRQPPAPSPFYPPPRNGMKEPLPRASPPYYANVQHPINFDESLRLPPLQTRVSNLGPVRSFSQQRADSQESGIEAMVLTIPFHSKIKVLSRISLPLAPPGPTSPAQDIRGTVVAVEGAHPALMAEVGRFIREHLSKEPDYLVKTFTPPPERSAEPEAMDEIEMIGTSSKTSWPPTPKIANPFITYLKTIEYWHERSQEIINFITTIPNPALPSVAIAFSPTTASAPPPTPVSSSLYPTDSSPISANDLASAPATTPALNPSQKPQTPIALLPEGFSLTMSDAAAIAVPINDAYAPVDHWQWMATLWRGIVGADLVIYVRLLHVGTASQLEREGAEEMARCGAVEVRRDCGPCAVIVRVPLGPGVGREDGRAAAGPAKVEEATLRRLGFEVLEIIRGGLGKTGGFARA